MAVENAPEHISESNAYSMSVYITMLANLPRFKCVNLQLPISPKIELKRTLDWNLMGGPSHEMHAFDRRIDATYVR